MDGSTKNTINRTVRCQIRREFGRDDTCVVSVRVLSEVLKRGWGVDITPHVVHLKVFPPRVLEILENRNLSPEVIQQISKLPKGEGIVGIISTEKEQKIHVIGTSIHDNEMFLWDPSIDQVNQHLASCELEPICVSFKQLKQFNDGNGKWDYVERDGCWIMYSKEEQREENVFNSSAWVADYSHLVERVLSLCGRR